VARGLAFSPPLNSWHQLFNGNGDEPARFLAVTSAPCMINLIHNTDFIFNCPYVFRDRFNLQEEYFNNPGTWYSGRTWQTNFVADVKNLKLLEWRERRGGGSQVRLEVSENTLCGDISQFSVGTYKKAHFDGPGAHVIILSGHGYSLLWPQGREIKRSIGDRAVSSCRRANGFTSTSIPERSPCVIWPCAGAAKNFTRCGARVAGKPMSMSSSAAIRSNRKMKIRSCGKCSTKLAPKLA
jgi:hypothetical protein